MAFLDQLDRDAAALLYAAGELPDEDREAFERRLAAEPELAAEVERLRAAQAAVAAELECADARSRLPASEGVAVRRVSRAINQWLVNRAAAAAAPSPVRAPIIPWWVYPSAVAASLIVGFLVWSSRQEVPPMPAAEEAQKMNSQIVAEQQELADWLASSVDPRGDASVNEDLEEIAQAAGVNGIDGIDGVDSADSGSNSLYPLPRLPREETSQ